ncbi:hypothetical protein [Jannaschia ovalis]|uniref:EF hand n=1 Tax=Jannaschia ovalis TaxID=3038773 RepID=A0ABY8LA92_9RHOB|nr:hypothetical protein [Jannaschia sp. GRR-S6-38]WGH78266.1 hypothetical protein P8627_14730 [Jannaschia sp. GRR-S6-38]
MTTRLALNAALALALAAPASAQTVLGWAMLSPLQELDRDGDGQFEAGDIDGFDLPEAWDMDQSGTWSIVEISQSLWAGWDGDDSGVLEQTELATMTGLAEAGTYVLE